MSNIASGQPVFSKYAGDADFQELIEFFVNDMPEKIEGLRESFETGDYDLLTRKAHQLKGASGSYGFDTVTQTAAKLELSLREQRPEDQIRTLYNELVAICGSVTSEIPNS